MLDKMHGWLRQKQNQVVPSTALGKAITFASGQWPKLIRYLDHPQLNLRRTTTPASRRSDHSCSGAGTGCSPAARAAPPRAHCSTGLIETAKANGREPYWYLRELFEKLPLAHTRADYLALLPTARPPPSSP